MEEELKKETKQEEEKEEPKGLTTQVNEIHTALVADKDVKKRKKRVKKARIPFRARISKRKLKQGYSTIAVVDANKNVTFEKQKIEGSTFKLGKKENETFHAINSEDILTYKGKPFIIQPKTKLNPCNPLKDSKNETYGQKYVMARMQGDFIKPKKKFGSAILWLAAIGIAGYFLMKGFG